MPRVLIAAFPTREQADKAIDHLHKAGYTADDISLITRGRDVAQGEKKGPDVGAAAATGGAIGGVAGLILGALGFVIIGPISALLGIGGLVGTTVTGAIVGAAAGGLVGWLQKIGLSKETAEQYGRTVEKGGVILAVAVEDLTNENIRRILENEGAEGTSELDMPDLPERSAS